ncbi:TIR domain-containing protein [Pedobacter sp. G11]|uniref:toll/interleukin-1 receptor domain-containing protein n=1 Tax=Pedobacter sp. G11 TaxID=2482728 RepID=UPI000F5FE9F8|nr:toll/interleukin-1 receptor domain-containing protein [Pedobacter sp. G11]AZI26675.1 TIR domain-containing protein [Pedobacter sp. G11]
MSNEYPSPRVFISYAWGNDAIKQWVLDFSTHLRNTGIDVTLDQWSLIPGDRTALFMEGAVRENNFVLIIGSEKYKEKSESRIGGVGYEGDIMTAEVLENADQRKFIPLIRSGDSKTAIPSWLSGKYYLDFSDDSKYEDNFDELVQTLLGIRNVAPPLGKIPEKYRIAMEKMDAMNEQSTEENITLPVETVPLSIKPDLNYYGPIPKIEAELIWHRGGRAPKGYSDKNPTKVDETGRLVASIGAGSKPIIHWQLDWHFDFVVHNSSSFPAVNILIKSVGVAHFRYLEKLPEVNNIQPFQNIALKADYLQMIESNHQVADEIMKFKIPQKLEGLVLEISYQNEQREEFTTLVKVQNNKLVNLIQ